MAQPIRAMCQSHDIIDWEKQQNVSLLKHVDLLPQNAFIALMIYEKSNNDRHNMHQLRHVHAEKQCWYIGP